MKIVVRFLVRAIITLIVLFVLIGVLAHYQKDKINKYNQPVWRSSSLAVDTDKTMLYQGKHINIQLKNNNLVLVRNAPLKSQLLFSNYKKKLESLSLYIKDLDQDGLNEIIFRADKKRYVSDVYVFSNLNKKNIKKYKGQGLFWDGGSLRFTRKDNVFVRSCGSQYCNDTYYKWNGMKLLKEYTDSYESM